MNGQIHALQSFGAADGPGLRFVVFTKGCPLRCGCCHNPDTWATTGGISLSPQALLAQIEKYRPYFGTQGGVTVSGGEPLLQPAFCTELFALCQQAGIHTCLDTSGCIMNQDIERLLPLCDLVLLDIKFMQEAQYQAHVGCSMAAPLGFLKHLTATNTPVWLRQVLLPGLNDSIQDLQALKALGESHKNVEKIELLPFKKLCTVKYSQMQIPFPLSHIPEPSEEQMAVARGVIAQ